MKKYGSPYFPLLLLNVSSVSKMISVYLLLENCKHVRFMVIFELINISAQNKEVNFNTLFIYGKLTADNIELDYLLKITIKCSKMGSKIGSL